MDAYYLSFREIIPTMKGLLLSHKTGTLRRPFCGSRLGLCRWGQFLCVRSCAGTFRNNSIQLRAQVLDR